MNLILMLRNFFNPTIFFDSTFFHIFRQTFNYRKFYSSWNYEETFHKNNSEQFLSGAAGGEFLMQKVSLRLSYRNDEMKICRPVSKPLASLGWSVLLRNIIIFIHEALQREVSTILNS